jgi:hypothetical protein
LIDLGPYTKLFKHVTSPSKGLRGYISELPNDVAIMFALDTVKRLSQADIKPDVILPDMDGGVVLAWLSDLYYADILLDNDCEIDFEIRIGEKYIEDGVIKTLDDFIKTLGPLLGDIDE